MIYSHRAFEDLAATFELPGLPDFMCRDDVAGLYGSATGHELRDLDWYIAYSAVQWAIVFLVTGRRAVAFGEREMPSDPEELLYNRGPLEGLIG
jgi:aminoglycoside phosphotransferase (APT) family kinase protein